MKKQQVGIEHCVGQDVLVENVLPNGTRAAHLGNIKEVTMHEIALEKVTRIIDMGRESKFMAGKYDEHTEYETYPPEQVKRLTRLWAFVTDWPNGLPTKSK